MQNSDDYMEMNNSSNPLVSVVVLTYNSSATVLETLDSIKNQTYRNIELIITDDASKDDTVSLCNKWLDANGERFVLAKVVTNEKNTGISANANRGCFASHGEWIKIIAGDDRLLPNCLDSYIKWVKLNPGYDIVFSKVIGFGALDSVAAKKCRWMDCHLVFEKLSKKEIITVLCFLNFLPAASAFFKKESFDALGGYDESIPFVEDWPFWLKALSKCFSIGFNNDFTTEYRFSKQSISQQGSNNKNPLFAESSEMASTYAHNMLKQIGTGAFFYKITTYNDFKYNSLLWKIIHSFNVLNPFFYYKKCTLRKFDSLLNKS